MTSPRDIRRRGLEALQRELGPAEMIHFLQQFGTRTGDYARERHAWVDETSLADTRAAAGRKR
jgi:hypothetical protein